MSPEIIAQNDPTMREYLKTLEQMDIRLQQLSRNVAPDRAWSAVLYSCVLPYSIGVVVMLALWAL